MLGGNCLVCNDSSAASSVFVFVVQSFLSPYKDAAHILPVSSLTAEMFHTYIKKIMIGLQNIGFKIISLVTDNNAINKKAEILLALKDISITYLIQFIF